jgi:hypothetical protein
MGRHQFSALTHAMAKSMFPANFGGPAQTVRDISTHQDVTGGGGETD